MTDGTKGGLSSLPRVGFFVLLLGLPCPAPAEAQAHGDAENAFDSWTNQLDKRLDQDLANLSSDLRRREAPLLLADRNMKSMLPTGFWRSGTFPLLKRELQQDMVRGILWKEGLPASLIGVVAVESGFDPKALSSKGALGLWQLMPATARRYGLVVDGNEDERLDPVKSTVVASRYLLELYNQFQGWPLALAAYNAGEERVQDAIAKGRSRDFWVLSRLGLLPEETRNYVPKVLGALRAGEGVAGLNPEIGAGISETSGTASPGHETWVYAITSGI